MSFIADTIEFITLLSTNTLLLFSLVAGFSFLALYLGKDWIISFIFSMFISSFLYGIIPFDLPTSNWYVFGTKIIIALLLTTILKHFIKVDFPYKNSKKYIQSVVLGLAATITLLATALISAYNFTPFISKWFEGNLLFWSSIVPFLILFFIIRK